VEPPNGAATALRVTLYRHTALGRRLRQIRTERRLSLAELARGTGICASYPSLIETGKSDVMFSRLTRIGFYGIRIADLLPKPHRRS
jgi:transcriptional regulator with XRE-family HTH domain